MLNHKNFVTAAALVVLYAAIPTITFAEAPTTRPIPSCASFSYSGVVIDDQGEPIPDVKVIATHQSVDGNGFGYIATERTDAHGQFNINRAKALSGASPSWVADSTIRLEFRHKNYGYAQLEDMHTFSPAAATHLSVNLHDGRIIEGRIVDAKRQAVADARVEVLFGDVQALRRATMSDANGRFVLRGLPAIAGKINVLTVAREQPILTASETVNAGAVTVGNISVSAIELPPTFVVHKFLGMKLIDVDADLQAMFHLPEADGVMVLDPGVKSERLNVGTLQRGDQFWLVGEKRVKNFDQFKSELSAAQRLSEGEGTRVVYNYNRVDDSGTKTQYLRLSGNDQF